MISEVPGSIDYPAVEAGILLRWKRDRTFEESIRRRQGCPTYIFYDGPPFATGLPHYGHILTSYIKDVVPRYFTMRGFQVPRQWGWDCHGLPVEFEVEKQFGFRSKKEILDYGVEAFNKACKDLVLRYASDWREVIERMGRWVDFDGAYKTMDRGYMESVVWAFKRLHERGLVYEGSKIVPYCVRCQTALSNFEARLDDAFRPRRDDSLFVKFRREDADNEYFLAWTTTPWTLPANIALAVAPNLEYSLVMYRGDLVWIASDAVKRLSNEFHQELKATRIALGHELMDIGYAALFPYYQNLTPAFRILAADFVDVAEGTGIVHVAPAYGEDDFELAETHQLPLPNPVKDDGTFDSTVGDLSGLNIFDAVPRIRNLLHQQGLLLFEKTIEHSYPHCWRCDQPLIYRAVDSWFIRVSTMRDELVHKNDAVNWIPAHIKEGRFGEWIRNARDWAVSRSRFWGSPIPAWKCEQCGLTEVIGTVEELEGRSGRVVTDLHRPEIDQHVLTCKACSGRMTRVAEVFDCWFESGAMPFASRHYPFENQQHFDENFPASFIVEYLAQTRGWFYTLFVLSVGCFESEPFRSAMCHGVILAADGRKMSKRLKNYPDPMDLMNEHGSDALRVALLASPVSKGESIRFSPASARDAVRRFHILLWNCVHFFTTYATIDNYSPSGETPTPVDELDRYLLHELEVLRDDIESSMENYDFAKVYSRIERFINLLSTWYIRLNKPRIWREGLDDDKRTCYDILFATFERFALLCAPFLPFLAEAIFDALGKPQSVHLQDWPTERREWLSHDLASAMIALRTIVSLVRNIREVNGVSQRIPLRSVIVSGVSAETVHRNARFLEDELNMKSVQPGTASSNWTTQQVTLRFEKIGKRLSHALKEVVQAVKAGHFTIHDDGSLLAAGHALNPDEYEVRLVVREGIKNVGLQDSIVVAVDLSLDDSLILEGSARELNRRLQDLRKKARLSYADRVDVSVVGGPLVNKILNEHSLWLMNQVLAVRISKEPLEGAAAEDAFQIESEEIKIGLRRSSKPESLPH